MKQTFIIVVEAPEGTGDIREALVHALDDPLNYPAEADVPEWMVTVSDSAPVIPVTNFELLRVLDGHELSFGIAGGGQARVRLYGVDELLDAQRDAAAGLPGPDPGMSRAAAVQLCRPLNAEAIARLVRRVGLG